MTVDTNHNYSLATDDEDYYLGDGEDSSFDDDLSDLEDDWDYDYYYEDDNYRFPDEEPEQ